MIIEPRFSPDQSRQINDLTADGILAKDNLEVLPFEQKLSIPMVCEVDLSISAAYWSSTRKTSVGLFVGATSRRSKTRTVGRT